MTWFLELIGWTKKVEAVKKGMVEIRRDELRWLKITTGWLKLNPEQRRVLIQDAYSHHSNNSDIIQSYEKMISGEISNAMDLPTVAGIGAFDRFEIMDILRSSGDDLYRRIIEYTGE